MQCNEGGHGYTQDTVTQYSPGQCHHTKYLTTATPGQPRGYNNEVDKSVLNFHQNILSVSYLLLIWTLFFVHL